MGRLKENPAEALLLFFVLLLVTPGSLGLSLPKAVSRLWHPQKHQQPSDSTPLSAAGKRWEHQEEVNLHTTTRVAEPEAPAGIQVAARQQLFNYVTQQALTIVQAKVEELPILNATKTFNLPIVGSFDLELTSIRIESFNVSAQDAQLTILEGFFHLTVKDIEARITFHWHWQKLGLQGSGEGELLLHGGNIDYVFDVHADEGNTGPPQLNVVTGDCTFASVELHIKSYSADWLYQAVMALFNEMIRKQVQSGIESVVSEDVPRNLNQVLASLPTHVSITGLPFQTTFAYSLYTSTFVLLKGYGEVGVATQQAPRDSSGGAGGPMQGVPDSAGSESESMHITGEVSDVLLAQEQQQQARPRLPVTRRALLARTLSSSSSSAAGSAVSAAAAPATTNSDAATAAAAAPAPGTAASSSTALWRAVAAGMKACPFDATQLPLTSDMIAAEPHMFSIYLHESLANCVCWALFNEGLMAANVTDGTIPNLHLTTDLLAMLIPDLPKTYPKQYLRLEAAATSQPLVSFGGAESGVGLNATYRLTIRVANATLGDPHIATMAVSLNVTALLDWDSTTVTSVAAQHLVEQASMAVPTAQWDGTVGWFVQNYGGLYPLHMLVDSFVHTPVSALVTLANAKAGTFGQWFELSSDLWVYPPTSR